MERIKQISPWLVIVSYALLVGLTSAVLVWFKLPDPFMIFLIVPVFFVGIIHPTRVHRSMIVILAQALTRWVRVAQTPSVAVSNVD